MFRQQTKTLKNCIFDDRSGNGYLIPALRYRPTKRQLNGTRLKGKNTKKTLFNNVFKAATKRKQFKIFTRQL